MNKKGFLQNILLLANPWVLLGLALFIVVMLLGLYFALPKILAIILVVGAIYLMGNGVHPAIGVTMLILGVLIVWNPFGSAIFELTTLEILGVG